MFTSTRSTFSRNCLALAAALAMGCAAHAAPEAEFQAALVQLSQGQKGEDGAIEKSALAFNALLQAEPGNPVLMAYTGAATSMQAVNTMLPWKKMAYAEDGMALLDKALALLTPAHDAVGQRNIPAVLDVRFVAANSFLAVPGFMNRAARGAKLLDEVVSSPLFAQAPLSFQGAVWLRAAKLAASEKRVDDARKYLNLVLGSKAPQASAAEAQLKALAS